MTYIQTQHNFIEVQEAFDQVNERIFSAAKSVSPFIRVKATHINANEYPEPKLLLINFNNIELVDNADKDN